MSSRMRGNIFAAYTYAKEVSRRERAEFIAI